MEDWTQKLKHNCWNKSGLGNNPSMCFRFIKKYYCWNKSGLGNNPSTYFKFGINLQIAPNKTIPGTGKHKVTLPPPHTHKARNKIAEINQVWDIPINKPQISACGEVGKGDRQKKKRTLNPLNLVKPKNKNNNLILHGGKLNFKFLKYRGKLTPMYI